MTLRHRDALAALVLVRIVYAHRDEGTDRQKNQRRELDRPEPHHVRTFAASTAIVSASRGRNPAQRRPICVIPTIAPVGSGTALI